MFLDISEDYLDRIPYEYRPHFLGHEDVMPTISQDFGAIMDYVEMVHKRNIFMSFNAPKIDPAVFKEIRNLELLSIKQLIATRQDKGLL